MAVRPIDAIELQKRMCALCNQDYADEPCEPSDCIFIRALNETPTLTQPNEPLTLDELREMDGDPVWFDTIKRWGIVIVRSAEVSVLTKSGEFDVTRLKFYRRPPEGEEK